MASDISNIIKSELSNTLANLLSVTSNVDDVASIDPSQLETTQCIRVESNFSFSSGESSWIFYIPTAAATKFEYLMLGGIADLKEAIDDEITDAVKEIVSTICGSIVTNVNAQGFDDLNGMNFTQGSSSVVSCSDENETNIYQFSLTLNDDKLIVYISFDDFILSYISAITGGLVDDPSQSVSSGETLEVAPASSGAASILSSILSDESVENLRLLFDVKLRLSVRLGSKVCLLRDVISWDIGEIIELTQMTNEPLDILINGIVIGQGEAVIVDGKFGVKIKYIGEPKID